jgi:hypothetical protein
MAKSIVGCPVTSSTPNLPDPSKFLLLYSIGVCTTKHMNQLVQEIIQFHGSKSLSFTNGNNKTGTLIVLPSNRTLDRYFALISRNREDTSSTVCSDHTSSTRRFEEKRRTRNFTGFNG